MAVPSLFAVFIFAILQQSLTAFVNSNACQTLTVNNGNVRYTGSNGIQKFSFNCENGFSPMGRTFSTCLNGQWSNPNPFCVDKSSIKVVENGYMTMSADNKYNIACNEGFILLGNNEFKLDGSSSSKCIKTIVNEIKINFANGVYSVSEDKLTYDFQCNPGFQMYGQPRIQYINNAWTGAVPICLEKAATTTSQPITQNIPIVVTENKKVEINFVNGIYSVCEDGRTYEFQCNPGFQMYGQPKIQYINNAWTGPVPVCLAEKTAAPSVQVIPVNVATVATQQPPITHNIPIVVTENKKVEINFVNGIYSVCEDGRTYEFQCNPGFQMYGQSKIQYINNAWTGPVPVCLEKTAAPSVQVIPVNVATVATQQPPITHNIPIVVTENKKVEINFVNGIYSVCEDGRTYEFQCNPGFQMYGQPKIQYINNAWTGPVPLCLASVQQAPTTESIPIRSDLPKTIPNGKGKMNIDGSITFECNVGYSMYGYPVVQPQSNQFPVCVPTNDLVIENGRIEVQIVSSGYELLYTCNEGFQISSDENGMPPTGQQVNSKQTCVPACPILYFKNGWVESNNQSRTAHFGCCDGFQIQGPTESTCVNGLWTSPTPQCIPLCKTINLMNGQATYNRDSTTFTCNPGYYLLGAKETVCNNGKWMDDTPICVPNCPMPEIVNGDIIPDVKQNNFKIVCHNGFELFGSDEMSCVYGQWSQPAPICAADCQPLHINNGVAQNVRNSKVIRVQCNYGYVLNGTQEISCTGGNWSAPPPTCISLCEAVHNYGLQVDRRELLKFNCNF
ncbi:sushi, von Willebrand factor type A, EGF and pentraxin domain-containing protein 1-like isoform X2 [Leptopilina heterotoma]|uniref:sushi, von Willebrand factor type A, EGF and pentraxin domain-containing protein 1-like isoform X2 n=1 Tax=Leptopilina heterotoma TaxID=63436 RepID=UPI001CA9A691|nr:sushi, von Willebrand factor type A, EGF and pentraxin domain-containing protein 1-like isoform X2 [Leptopilina heterotoma]